MSSTLEKLSARHGWRLRLRAVEFLSGFPAPHWLLPSLLRLQSSPRHPPNQPEIPISSFVPNTIGCCQPLSRHAGRRTGEKAEERIAGGREKRISLPATRSLNRAGAIEPIAIRAMPITSRTGNANPNGAFFQIRVRQNNHQRLTSHWSRGWHRQSTVSWCGIGFRCGASFSIRARCAVVFLWFSAKRPEVRCEARCPNPSR